MVNDRQVAQFKISQQSNCTVARTSSSQSPSFSVFSFTLTPSPYITNIYKKESCLKGTYKLRIFSIWGNSGWKLSYMHKSQEPLGSAQTVERDEIGRFGKSPLVLKERHLCGIGCGVAGGNHILGGDRLLVCNFPLNKKRRLTFSIYISMNVLYYCFKNLMK